MKKGDKVICKRGLSIKTDAGNTIKIVKIRKGEVCEIGFVSNKIKKLNVNPEHQLIRLSCEQEPYLWFKLEDKQKIYAWGQNLRYFWRYFYTIKQLRKEKLQNLK